jgi:hypothetical protein
MTALAIEHPVVRGFRWESDMATPTREAISDLLIGSLDYFVIDEIQAGQGIVDLLAASLDDDLAARRLAAGIGPVTLPLRVRALSSLPAGCRWTSIDLLARRVSSRPKPLMRSTLGPLSDLGLIEIEAGKVRSTGVWAPLPARLTAIELKLSKWRDAVRQADNAAWCCDHAWVVLDSHRAGGALARLDYVRCFGVGLALVDSAGRLSIVQRPRQRRHVRWLRSLVGELAWQRALDGS